MDPTITIPANAPGIIEFYQQRDLIWLLLQTLTIGFPLVLLFTGLAARLRTACSNGVRGRRYPALVSFAGAYLALAALVVLPVAYWHDVAHRLIWNIPADSTGDWLVGRAVGLVVQII